MKQAATQEAKKPPVVQRQVKEAAGPTPADLQRDATWSPGSELSSPHLAAAVLARPPAQRAPMLLHLQRTQGNRFVQRVIAHVPVVQAKLEVSAPHDAYEREADAIADRVMRLPAPEERDSMCTTCAHSAGGLQRSPIAPVEPIQRAGSGVPSVSPPTAATIYNPGPGRPLSPTVRGHLEPHLGVSLSHVRVHDDPAATQAAASLQARAFTHGHNIFLGRHESSDNVRLMAHETTHVVQQGAAPVQRASTTTHVQRTVAAGDETLIQRAPENAAPTEDPGLLDIISSPDVATAAWALLARFAPVLVPILRQITNRGIITYLADLIRGAFDRLFGALGGDRGALDGLMATFGGLLGGVGEILGALASGDCQPLFNAVGRLGEVVQQLAGEAWDAIVAFFRPIGDFFSDLWQSFGVPVIDWLKRVAGDVWDGIQTLGRQLWDLTKPVRDALSAAWTWIKNQLGIGEGEEGQQGLLQWIQAKAAEAWDWVKAQIEPVIAPMRAAVDRIRAILPLDAILNLRETVRGWLGNVRGMVQNLRQPQDVVQNQDSLRNEILPAVLASVVGLRSSLVGAGQWVASQIGALLQTVTGFIESLRSNAILGHLAGVINWIQAGVVSLAQWAQSTVMDLFSSIGNGLVYLSRFIEPVLNTLQKVISVLGDVVSELPGLVLGPFWKMIPACIREPIKNFIIEHILRNIPIISTFLGIPDIWSKIQNLVLDFLRRVFVQGDLSGAVMQVIRFVLEAAGVNVDLFLNILANAADAIETIIMDPMAFLRNLFGALRQGFNQFVSNIGQHLISGLLGWLLGPLQDMGVTPPKELTLMSVLDLVLQILGISAAKLREKAEKLIGKKAVRVLEEAWRWVSALIRGGLSGLWEEIKTRLSDLWNIVIGGISQWVTVNIVKAGVEWLAKLSNPVGWVVGAIQVIYDVLSFFVNRINQILGLVNAVVSSIKQIAEGSIGAAANWIEEAMDRTLPTIIAFLADLVGISDPAPSVRDIVKSIREKVDKALDWLVDKAKAIGQRILGALGLGGREEKKPAAAEPDVPAVTFTAAGESHRLWTELEGGRPVLMIASNGAPFDTFMADLEERVKNLSDEQKKTELQSKIPQARQIANETKIDFAKVAELLRADKPNEAGPKKEEVSDDEQRLANLLQSILENLPKKETGEVDKAKDAFKTRLFSRRELEEILEISKTMANERTNLWMQQGILYKLSSSAFDPLTLYSFDQDKAGQREVNPNNRRKYGYINPAKDSDIGLQILSKGLRTDSPQPILKDDAAYHRTQAKYDSQRPGSRYQNFGYVVAILGHKDPGASGHWNRTGHTQSKNDNTQWNRDPANYQGPEHEIESAASGPEAERYRVPSKEIGSHPEWL